VKSKLLIANWKLHKDLPEALGWLRDLKSVFPEPPEGVTLVICPSFPLLPPLHAELEKLGWLGLIKLGAQTVSGFREGEYTGEVGVRQIKDWVEYVLVGHSERRRLYGETDDQIVRQARLCLEEGLVPVVCVSDQNQVASLARTTFSLGRLVVAYEPPFAIGSGQPDTPESAGKFAWEVKRALGPAEVLYGGSVSGENVAHFLGRGEIDGVLVGGASLEAGALVEIIRGTYALL